MPHLLVTHSQFRSTGPLRVFLALVFSSPSPGTARVPGVSDWRGIHSLRGGLPASLLWPQAGWVALSFSFTASHPPFRLLEAPGNCREELPCPQALELRDFQAGQLGRWSEGGQGGGDVGLEAEGQGGGAGAAVQTLGPCSPGSRRSRGQACCPAGAELRGRVWASLGTGLTAAHHAAGLTSGHWSHRNGVLLPGGVEARQGCDS